MPLKKYFESLSPQDREKLKDEHYDNPKKVFRHLAGETIHAAWFEDDDSETLALYIILTSEGRVSGGLAISVDMDEGCVVWAAIPPEQAEVYLSSRRRALEEKLAELP